MSWYTTEGKDPHHTLRSEVQYIRNFAALPFSDRAPENQRRALFSELEKDASGYIVADESTKTSIGGVFAVGDVRTKVLRQVVTAVGDGAVASYYAEEFLSLNE